MNLSEHTWINWPEASFYLLGDMYTCFWHPGIPWTTTNLILCGELLCLPAQRSTKMAVSLITTVFDNFWAISLTLLLPLAFYSLWNTWSEQSHIPGPFLASLTNLPRLWWSYSSTAHLTHIKLHERYGDLVRIGPGCISVGDPREISKIYGISTNFQKVRDVPFPYQKV